MKRHDSAKIASFGREALGLDLGKESTTAIAQAAGKFSRSERLRLLAKLNLLLRGGSRKSETERVASAKFFVALLPDSLEHIAKWLGKRRDRWEYEIHFSLFCFLDDSLNLSLEPKVLAKIESLIVQYLRTAKSDTAHAAWMAADLLGHHWPSRGALDALLSVAREGQHVEGRRAALSGLQRRLEDHALNSRSEIIETLEMSAYNDNSPLIRRRALRLLEKTMPSRTI